ncbi:LysR family transcriptional regulator [Vibrio nitrifigilis]|uniref:LysR family transcriptional regulator n=1 Tax=Vibrio nitrifigilis TaxID=2789781 RepID=A0ABS0GM64_9VIBR|nr:LysR family transcriptional regulator [Vibrio nitrifigilis]MBF9003523.1 LysR family transcriptional regulator [Vibrio nitrifigilis]
MQNISAVNVRSLQFFIGVFDSQSFSIVARREGVSASMVSRIIKQLEDSLGQQLFYRNTRAVMPTEAGRLFVNYARNVLEQLGEAQKELLERQEEPTGLVRINAPVYFGQKHIAPWLSGLADRYPQLTIELIQTDDFIDPHKDAADVLFRIGTLSDSSFHARVFGTQHYYLAAAPSYIEKHGIPTDPKELNKHKSLVYKGSSGQNRWLFRQHGQEWQQYEVTPLLASNNAETLVSCALQGMGVVLFPDWLISEYLQTGQLVRLLSDYHTAVHTEPQHIAAIYPYARHPSLNVRAVIDYFVEVYGEPLYWLVK